MFVVLAEDLHLYDREESFTTGVIERELILLETYFFGKANNDAANCEFFISNDHQTLSCKANTNEEMEYWIACLQIIE